MNSTTSGVVMVLRPASWKELTAMFGLGLLVGLGLAMAVWPTCAFAGGPTVVSWNQDADCAAVTGWELLQAPITTTNPNPQPTAAVVGVTIPNTGTPPCGLAMTRTVTASGVGPTRFWLRALAGATKSGESNSVDASLPLGKPLGLTVVPQ